MSETDPPQFLWKSSLSSKAMQRPLHCGGKMRRFRARWRAFCGRVGESGFLRFATEWKCKRGSSCGPTLATIKLSRRWGTRRVKDGVPGEWKMGHPQIGW